MNLKLPDISPYQTKSRRADPTDGVVARWLQARGLPVPGKWTKASRRAAYEALGIPWLKRGPAGASPAASDGDHNAR